MSFHDLMDGRWSCREFLPEPLPDDLLAQVFTTAQRTASWCNAQPWRVHLLSGAALASFSQRLTDHVRAAPDATCPDLPLPERYVGAYAARRSAAATALYDSLGIARADAAARTEQSLRNYSCFGAPHLAVITSERDHGAYGVLDCGAYVANLMNAALDVGIASIAQGSLGVYAGRVRELLDLPQERLVVCGVALGRPDAAHPVNALRTSRAALDELVTVVGCT